MMSFRTRRQLKLSDVEPKVIKVEEEVVIEPIVIKEEVEKEVLEKLVEEVVEEIKEKIEEIKREEVKEEVVEEVIVEEKKEEVVEEVVEENKYAVEEFVVIDGKKVSKFDLEPVVCLNTGVRYDNNKIAMQETGVNSGAIKRNCRGFTKCAGKDENGKKLVWKFAKDVE